MPVPLKRPSDDISEQPSKRMVSDDDSTTLPSERALQEAQAETLVKLMTAGDLQKTTLSLLEDPIAGSRVMLHIRNRTQRIFMTHVERIVLTATARQEGLFEASLVKGSGVELEDSGHCIEKFFPAMEKIEAMGPEVGGPRWAWEALIKLADLGVCE